MNYWTKVNPKGYKVLKKIISQDEVFEIRKNLDSFFSGYPKKRMLNLEDSIKEVGSIENIQLNKSLLSSISSLFSDGDWKYVNDFQVLKNMASKGRGGWHADCNSQYSMPHLNKDMSLQNYKFLKIGLYLQGPECKFGSSIETIPYSHLLPKWGYKLLTFCLNKTFFGEFLARLISVKLDKLVDSGDCILFDCRLIHRSSPVYGEDTNSDLFNKVGGAYEIHKPGENKYAFYFEVGDSKSCIQFLRSNTERVKYDNDNFFIEYLSKNKEYFFDIFSANYKKELFNKIAFLEEEDLIKIKKFKGD